MPRRFAWATLPDQQLLQVRFRNLRLSLNGTWVEACLEDLYGELAKRGLRIYEVGISYWGRTYEEGKKIGWKDGIRAIWCLFKYAVKKLPAQS